MFVSITFVDKYLIPDPTRLAGVKNFKFIYQYELRGFVDLLSVFMSLQECLFELKMNSQCERNKFCYREKSFATKNKNHL